MPQLRTVSDKHLERFFDFSRERYNILLRRRAGEPAPWTDDPVLATWRFCNVFREDDRTTAWFRENIRDPMKNSADVIMATMAFRAFNRVETGEILKPFLLAGNWDLSQWRQLLVERHAAGNPVCTGAYIIKTAPDMSKIDGVLWQLGQAKLREPQLLTWHWHTPAAERSQHGLWSVLRSFPYVGDFTANEIVVDLTHTSVLEMANDLATWTNPGPGCALGLGMLLHGNPQAYNRHSAGDRAAMMEIMYRFLAAARPRQGYWPEEWPEWTLHTVEWQFCELSKYLRGLAGQKLKRRYHGMANPEPVCN